MQTEYLLSRIVSLAVWISLYHWHIASMAYATAIPSVCDTRVWCQTG